MEKQPWDKVLKDKKYHRTLIILVLMSITLIVSSFAYGQDADAEGTQWLRIKLLEDLRLKADQKLSQYLEKDQYHFDATIELSNVLPQTLPYAPTQDANMLGQLDDPTTQKLIKSIVVKLYLAEDIDSTSRDQLVAILKQALVLDESRGDKVTAEDLKLKVPRKKDEIEKKLDKTETLLREANKDLKGAEDSLNEVKSKVSDLESEREKLAKELEAAKVAAKNESEASLDLKFWIEKLVYAVVALIIFLVLLVTAKILAGSIKSVGEGIGSIGSGLQGIAGSISNMSLKKESDDGDKKSDSNVNDPQPLSQLSGGGESADVRKQVLELHEELSTKINERTETLLLDYITGLLNKEHTVINAVATMELLGQERANYLFNRLNRQDQDKVLQFINQGGYGTQKYQKMLESGENLKTKLLQGAFHVKKGLENRNILENLLTMAEGDIANLAVDFDQEHLARLFLYLDPAKSAGVLQSIYRQNQDVFDKAISAIPQIPNFVEKRDLDQRIEQSISKYKETQANDAQLPYLQHYYNLITSMDENLTELTLERMSQSSERVGNFLKEKVVTFALLFELNDEQQADLVNKLNNKDIAILLVALDKDLADQVKRQVPQRRQDMLTEELESLSGLANNKLALLLKTVKTKVVKDLQSLKAKGEISKKTSPINTEDNQSQAA